MLPTFLLAASFAQGEEDDAVEVAVSFASWLVPAGIVVAATLVAHKVLSLLVRWRLKEPWALELHRRTRDPLRLILVSLALMIVVGTDDLSERVAADVEQILQITLIVGLAWLGSRGVGAGAFYAESQLDQHEPDSARSRRLRTQMDVAKRAARGVIWVLGGAAVLWTFESVRVIGTSVLASAGIVGIIAGVAAQSSLGNFFAGIQIAVTAPIRHDDVVVVEGEWGRIEEITLTFVVVRIWDDRRLVLPTSYFVNQNYEVWSRTSTELTGVVVLPLAPAAPVERIRQHYLDLVRAHPNWDGRVARVQVVDVDRDAMTVRFTASARNSALVWDLRCDLREAMLGWLAADLPGALPAVRVEPEPASHNGRDGDGDGAAGHGRSPRDRALSRQVAAEAGDDMSPS